LPAVLARRPCPPSVWRVCGGLDPFISSIPRLPWRAVALRRRLRFTDLPMDVPLFHMHLNFNKLIKRLPVISSVAKYSVGNLIQRRNGKRNTTIFRFNANFRNEEGFEFTKYCKDKSLYQDRFNEIRMFFRKSRIQMFLHYLRNGTPNTAYYKYRLDGIFEDVGLDKENLKHAYETAAFVYVNRLMLRYHNYHIGKKVIQIAKQMKLPVNSLRVLDYGCGVSDASLYLALYGMDVTILDLDDEKLDFALKRFTKRNLEIKCIRVDQTEYPANLESEKYDIIIMAEFLEHVRNPRRFLAYALDHLDDFHGIFYDSLGPVHNHGVGGDHLEEAKKLMDKSDYQEYFNNRLVSVNYYLDSTEFDFFYFKRLVN